MGYNLLAPSGVVVSDHAIRRLRLRFGCTRSWPWQRCEAWIVHAIVSATVVVQRGNGEVYARADLAGRALYLAALPSADGAACLVRTVLTHAFATNNLNHRRSR